MSFISNLFYICWYKREILYLNELHSPLRQTYCSGAFAGTRRVRTCDLDHSQNSNRCWCDLHKMCIITVFYSETDRG